VVTGELRSQIDKIWNDFWSGGISNPLEVIEQLTSLLFIKRLDDLHGVEQPDVRYKDSLAEEHGAEEEATTRPSSRSWARRGTRSTCPRSVGWV